MSVEAYVIAAIVDEGTPKKAFQADLQPDDFTLYMDEYLWIVDQAARGRTINRRRFQQAFPEFEWIRPEERTQQLIEELKDEAGYMKLASALEQVSDDLSPDNFTEKADFIREVANDVLRVHSPSSDVILNDGVAHYLKQMKSRQILRQQGVPLGISTGIQSLDAHLGGLVGGRSIVVLGRPGDAKSMTTAKMFATGFLEGRVMAMFSPEMDEFEHRARIATLITAIPEVREELGLKNAFRNRALLDGTGYNYKSLKRFWEWVEKQPGAMILFTKKWRMLKMTPSFIESRINEMGIEACVVDPIYKLKPSQRMNHRASGWERLNAIMDELVDISEAHNIPMVITNQAHRQQGNRGDAPTKDNSFGSDSPVQEGDAVIGVKHIKDEKKLIIRCTKNRFGEEFRVDLRFLPNIGKIEDVDFKDPHYYNGHEDGSSERTEEAYKELEKEMGHQQT